MPKNLRVLREARGLSLAALAELSGIGKSTLGNYEQGKTDMSRAKIKALATCLKTTPEEVDLFVPEPEGVRPASRRAAPCTSCAQKDARIAELERQLAVAQETINNLSKVLAQGRTAAAPACGASAGEPRADARRGA